MKSKNMQIQKCDKVLLVFAGITAVVFSVIPEKAREAVEYVYLLCLMTPFMCWWILAREKIEGKNNHGN
jgi:hypothetical protein